MDIEDQVDHIDALTGYLQSRRLIQHGDMIEEELVDFVSRCEAHHRIAFPLLSLGCARVLGAYVTRHCLLGLENGSTDVLDMLCAGSGADEALASLEIVKPAIQAGPLQQLIRVLRIFGDLDAPEHLEAAMTLLDLDPALLPRAFCEVGPWGEKVPRMAA